MLGILVLFTLWSVDEILEWDSFVNTSYDVVNFVLYSGVFMGRDGLIITIPNIRHDISPVAKTDVGGRFGGWVVDHFVVRVGLARRSLFRGVGASILDY